MELTGILQSVGPIESYQGRDGQTFVNRQIVVTTNEAYPQTAVFTLRNNIAADFVGEAGEQIIVHFDFRGFRSKDGRMFNNLSAWRADIINSKNNLPF